MSRTASAFVPSRCGFTLIELLVVISIIALMIAILLPALSKARMQAKVIECRSNIRQTGIAAMMYANDHQQYMPPHYRAYNLQRPELQVTEVNGGWPPIPVGLGILFSGRSPFGPVDNRQYITREGTRCTDTAALLTIEYSRKHLIFRRSFRV